MPITLKRKVVKIGGSLRLTIPPEIAALLQIKEGDHVEFDEKDGEVILRSTRKKSSKKEA